MVDKEKNATLTDNTMFRAAVSYMASDLGVSEVRSPHDPLSRNSKSDAFKVSTLTRRDNPEHEGVIE